MKIITSIKYITLSFALVACSSKKEEVEKEEPVSDNLIELTEGQFKSAEIKLGTVEQHTVSGALKVNGKLDVPPQNLVSVSAPFGGFLKDTELLQGMKVKKGERIAVMENQEYIQLQQDYLDSYSQLEFLDAEYKRQQELAKENVNAQKSLQQAKASYLSKQAMVSGLHAKLKMLNVNFDTLHKGEISSTFNMYSPIDGFITEVNFNMGSFVNPTDVLFKIVDTRHLHCELTVFEKDAMKIVKGQTIRFTLAGNGKERLAKVYLIGREISPDRTVRIHGHLDDEETNLLPGMYLSAVIEIGNTTATTLPEAAVVNYEGEDYIFTAKDTTVHVFEMINVKVGLHESGFVEVDLPEGMPKTTPIVVNGAYSLLSKLKNNEEE